MTEYEYDEMMQERERIQRRQNELNNSFDWNFWQRRVDADKQNDSIFDEQSYTEADKRLHRNIKEENLWLAAIFILILIGAAIWGYFLFS